MLVDYGFNSSTVVSFLVFFFFFLIEWARLRQFFLEKKDCASFIDKEGNGRFRDQCKHEVLQDHLSLQQTH